MSQLKLRVVPETKQEASRRQLLDALGKRGYSASYTQKVARFLSTPIGNAFLKTAISLGVVAAVNLVVSLVKR